MTVAETFLMTSFCQRGISQLHLMLYVSAATLDYDSASQWYFNLVLRGDDSITGLSSYRTQSFAETTVNADGSRQATALRNDETLSYADVVLLETELNQDYADQDKWKQVDIDGDGKLVRF